MPADHPPDNWPPYDIAKIGDNDYRITVAVAGFAEDELSMTQEHNVLTIAGQKSTEENGEYLHRGIAGRAFERRFQLADHVKVTGAELKHGLLTVDLKREIPEEMKPRRIAIGGRAQPGSRARTPKLRPRRRPPDQPTTAKSVGAGRYARLLLQLC